MPESPVDPSLTRTSARLIEHWHSLELRCHDQSSVSRELNQLLHQQAELATTQGVRVSGLTEAPDTLSSGVGERLVAERDQREGTYDTLLATYDSTLREMASLGRQALKNAGSLQGRERTEELKDALKLLQGVLQHPIGSRNYAVWFEVGWVQWELGEPLATATDSFYHAARLSGNSDPLYRLIALRHQALLLSYQERWGEAWEQGQSILSLAGEDAPEIWVEVARYALKAGSQATAEQLVRRALDHDPTTALALFSDPDLSQLHASSRATLESFTQTARQSAARQLEYLRDARKLKEYLDRTLGLNLSLPTPLTIPSELEQCGLFEAHYLARGARHEATTILSEAIHQVENAREQASLNARRMQTQIDQVLSEKVYYEGSLKNIEEHARESGFSLHPYSFNNPLFRRRNQKAEDARFAYESFRQKLAQSEQFLKEHLPAMEATYEKHESRRVAVEEVLQHLYTLQRQESD